MDEKDDPKKATLGSADHGYSPAMSGCLQRESEEQILLKESNGNKNMHIYA